MEYTIEGNFESTTKEKLKIYKKYGINRLSFGLETLNKKQLHLLDRNAEKKQIETVLEISKDLGFKNRNIDLIYALPNQQIKDVEEDLEYLISLDIEHISTYSLIIEEHTKLKLQGIQNISEDLDFEMYQKICQIMKKNNYNHYEISNFSKEGYESKHNNCYWDNEEYYGFGLGASSYRNSNRIKNTKSLSKYLNKQYQIEKELLTEKEKIEYEVLLNLRKKEGISYKKFQLKYHKDLKDYYQYQLLIDQGFLVEEKNHLFIPEDKWYISNEIIVKLLEKEI